MSTSLLKLKGRHSEQIIGAMNKAQGKKAMLNAARKQRKKVMPRGKAYHRLLELHQ